MLRAPEPVVVVDLFPAERAALLKLLTSLTQDDWLRPTIANPWTVKDIAAHLVADDLGRVSRERDAYSDPGERTDEPLEGYVDRRNADWVTAMRRLSPAVIVSLLQFSGNETQELFESLDPFAVAGPVTWAGPGPAPRWLDLAREFTERWHHQQQIREAVGAPLLIDPAFLRPVLATFAFALVAPYREVDAPQGTVVQLNVRGPSGGDWCVVRDSSGWQLRVGRAELPSASISMDEDTAWRMYIRGLPPGEVEWQSTVEGDVALGRRLLGAFALVS